MNAIDDKLYFDHFDAIYLHHDYLPALDDTLSHDTLPTSYTALCRRMRLSREKLARFFGCSWPPYDLSLRVIERYGLAALLQSNVPLVYFLRHLLDQWAAENLFFYCDVENFEQVEHSNAHNRAIAAQRIYDTFIKRDAIFEVNLVAHSDQRRHRAMLNGDAGCFEEAKEQALLILVHRFEDFKASELYQEMLSNIGDMDRSLYDRHYRHQAADYILRYLECPMRSEPANSMQHEQYIRQMARVFCRRRLNVRFPRLCNLFSSTAGGASDSREQGIEDTRGIEQEMSNSIFTPPRQPHHAQPAVELDGLDFLGDHFF